MPCHRTDPSATGRAATAATLAGLMAASEFMGLCDGFRAPNQAIWLSARPMSASCVAETQRLLEDGSGLVRSHFWWGPSAAALAHIEHLQACFETVLAAAPKGTCVLVALWQVDAATALTAALALGGAALASPSFAGMRLLATDATDNGPTSLWEAVADGALTPAELARVLRATTVPSVWADLGAVQSDEQPALVFG